MPTETAREVRPFPPAQNQNSFGLLRLLLAALVVYAHCWYLGGFGDEPLSRTLFAGAVNLAGIGVQGFFVISGYLVLQSERRTGNARAFLTNRLLRIYPGLWFCLALTGLVLPAIVWSLPHAGPAEYRGAVGYFWRNLVLPRSQIDIPGLFSGMPKAGDLNGSLWTLPYELGCYGLLGLLGWLGLTRPRSILPWLAGAALLALYLFDVSCPEHALFFKSPGRALCAWFVTGGLCALIPEGVLRPRLGWPWFLAALGGLLASSQLGFAAIAGPLLMPIIVLWLAWHLPASRWEQAVGGDYSYGLYIYAYPVQQTLAWLGLQRKGVTAYFFGAMILTLPLAILSWHLIEKAAARLKRRPPAVAA